MTVLLPLGFVFLITLLLYSLVFYKNAYKKEKKLRILLYNKHLSKSSEIETILFEKEKQYQDIYDTANSIILRWDPNFKIRSINPYAGDFFGVSRETLDGKDLVTDLFHIPKDKVNEKKSLLWNIFHRPEQFIIQEYEVFLSNGDKRTISWSNRVLRDQFGYPFEVLSIGNDITNRKLAEENLLKSYERILDLYNNAPCGYHSLDQNGLIVSINDTELEWLGYSRDEIVGKKYFSEILSPPSLILFEKSWDSLLKDGYFAGLELEFIRKDGSNFFTRLNSTVTKDSLGNFSISKSTVFDVTDKKMAEDILNDYSQKIEIQNKQLQHAVEVAELANKSKSVFFSKITHELRTPLHAVIGFSQILAKDTDLPTHLREYVNSLYENGVHLLGMINDILDISKIEAGKMTEFKETFSLKQLWETIYSMFAYRFKEKGIKFEILNPRIILNRFYFADIQKIRQILVNLIGNSFKFTSKGTVTFEIQIQDTPNSNYDEVIFSIEDTGIGIPQDQLEVIFEAFQQTEQGKSYQQGTGLGLSISHQFVELLNGKIGVESKMGVGSKFHFSLPLEKISQKIEPKQELGPISSFEIQTKETGKKDENLIQEFFKSLPKESLEQIMYLIRIQNFDSLVNLIQNTISENEGKELLIQKILSKKYKFLLSLLQNSND